MKILDVINRNSVEQGNECCFVFVNANPDNLDKQT